MDDTKHLRLAAQLFETAYKVRSAKYEAIKAEYRLVWRSEQGFVAGRDGDDLDDDFPTNWWTFMDQIPLNNGASRSFVPGLRSDFLVLWPPLGTLVATDHSDRVFMRTKFGFNIGNVRDINDPKRPCRFTGTRGPKEYIYDAFFFPAEP